LRGRWKREDGSRKREEGRWKSEDGRGKREVGSRKTSPEVLEGSGHLKSLASRTSAYDFITLRWSQRAVEVELKCRQEFGKSLKMKGREEGRWKSEVGRWKSEVRLLFHFSVDFYLRIQFYSLL
jgi:hypothetical protein